MNVKTLAFALGIVAVNAVSVFAAYKISEKRDWATAAWAVAGGLLALGTPWAVFWFAHSSLFTNLAYELDAKNANSLVNVTKFAIFELSRNAEKVTRTLGESAATSLSKALSAAATKATSVVKGAGSLI